MRAMVCVFVAIGVAVQETETALPTFNEVVAHLAATEAKVNNLSVTTDYVKVDAFVNNPPLRLEMSATATVDTTGRLTYTVKGEQGAGGGKTFRGQWQGAYDGQCFRSLQSSTNGQPLSGAIDDHWSMHGLNPLEFTTRYFHQSIAGQLKEKGGKVVEAVQVGGRKVLLVEMPEVKTDELRKMQFSVDPERWVVVKRAISRKPEGHDWHEYTRLETSDYVEVKPGVWLPGKVKQESLQLDRKTGKDKLSWSFAGTNRDWRVNQSLTANTFNLEFPAGVQVTDRRTNKQ